MTAVIVICVLIVLIDSVPRWMRKMLNNSPGASRT
jgi:hypothetical protein